uniref:Selenoprotein L n=1 Tax=Knipowitschia caucasica TaxID=637954 RepID=A0AAV2K7T2_KNICA
MAAALTEEEDTLLRGLSLLVSLGTVLLQKAKEEAAESMEGFLPYKITTMFGLITGGTTLFRDLGVTKKSEAEELWKKSYHLEAVREQVDALLQLEIEWDAFLEHVDQSLLASNGQESPVMSVESLSADTALIDARSSKSVTLGEFLVPGQKQLLVLIRHAEQALLEARSVRVLVVSFSVLEGAQIWLEQTGCTLPMLLDQQRSIYRSFGLVSSYSKVMRFGCLLSYSEFGAVDRDFPEIPPRLLEDLYQMGGDFLIDETGKVILSHASKTPLDRPSVEDILKAAD